MTLPQGGAVITCGIFASYLTLVPVERRIGGPGASLVMGAFTHASPERAGRFTDGTYGVWYCGDRLEVALAETAHHFERFMRATAEPAGEADYRELTCGVHGNVVDASPTSMSAASFA